MQPKLLKARELKAKDVFVAHGLTHCALRVENLSHCIEVEVTDHCSASGLILLDPNEPVIYLGGL